MCLIVVWLRNNFYPLFFFFIKCYNIEKEQAFFTLLWDKIDNSYETVIYVTVAGFFASLEVKNWKIYLLVVPDGRPWVIDRYRIIFKWKWTLILNFWSGRNSIYFSWSIFPWQHHWVRWKIIKNTFHSLKRFSSVFFHPPC